MDESNGQQPQQQSCSMTNGLGCLLVPACVWIGVNAGFHRAGIGGALLGFVLGAVAAVILIPLTLVLVVAFVHVLNLLAGLPARLRR